MSALPDITYIDVFLPRLLQGLLTVQGSVTLRDPSNAMIWECELQRHLPSLDPWLLPCQMCDLGQVALPCCIRISPPLWDHHRTVLVAGSVKWFSPWRSPVQRLQADLSCSFCCCCWSRNGSKTKLSMNRSVLVRSDWKRKHENIENSSLGDFLTHSWALFSHTFFFKSAFLLQKSLFLLLWAGPKHNTGPDKRTNDS